MSKNVKKSEKGYKPVIDPKESSEVQEELEVDDTLKKSILEEKLQKGRW